MPGVGILVVFCTLTMVGAVAAGAFGRFFVNLSDRFVTRMPIVRNVYRTIKQITEAMFKQSSQAFRSVVMIEYPRKGIWSLGFITGATEGEVQQLTKDEVLNVFIPTTPNPTSGFLLFVPREDVRFLKMTVEDGIKMVVSAGLITPDHTGPVENPFPSTRR